MRNPIVRPLTLPRLTVLLAVMVPFVALLYGPSPALAQSLGTAESFAVLAGDAVTCTTSTINGDVGLDAIGIVTQTSCTINENLYQLSDPVAAQAYADFQAAYTALETAPACDFINSVADDTSATLVPGVYCWDAAVTQTDSVWTLDGECDDTWIFRIGTLGTGALTGTRFTVVHPDCPETCDNNVFWWTAQDATLTDTTGVNPFIGSILAGTSITVTGPAAGPRASLNGQALATVSVTLTDALVNHCPITPPLPPPILVPVFVIGDVEDHAVGDDVYFWGAQWWINNIMSGEVSPGASRASFKGFATRADLFCGGAWESRPGNSPHPPATIPENIVVVVTSTVVKDGPNIRGDIVQIVIVNQDGGYGPNPGHEGNGLVIAIACPQAPPPPPPR